MPDYTGLLDMINGGGAGRAGQTFEGGPLSGILNSMGVRPQGFQDRMSQVRPQARPQMPQQQPQRPPQMPAQAQQMQGPQPSPMQMRGASQPPQMGGQAQGMANVRPQMPQLPPYMVEGLSPDEQQMLQQYLQSKGIK